MTPLESAAAYLPALVEAQARHLRVPGVQVAVRDETGLLASFAVGVADVSTGEPLRTDHLFRIASHSKTFASTAVMQLVAAGRMRLDDPIVAFVPSLAGSPLAAATVRELLGHQAGIQRDGSDADFWQLERAFPDAEALVAEIHAAGHVAGRNEHFKYSNVGYSLVGLAIEAASGSSFADYVEEHVVRRLGLRNTGGEFAPARADQYAAGHTGLLLGEAERLPIEHMDTGVMGAATGVYSTAEDLTVYGSAHWLGDDRLVDDDAKRLMQRTETTVQTYGREAGRYGLGMQLSKIRDRELVGHSGGYPGHITRTYIDPVGKLVVSVLTNAVDGPAEQIAQAVFAVLDAAAAPLPGAAKEHLAADGPAAETFTGRYASLWGLLDVVELDGRLVALDPAAADVWARMDELAVIDADTLRSHLQSSYSAAGEPLRFTRDADGAVTAVNSEGVTHWPLEDFIARRPGMTRVADDA